MNCKHCGFAIGEDDHRCQRCGRRVTGVVIGAPSGYSGANALAMAAAASASPDTLDTQEFLRQRMEKQIAAENKGQASTELPAQSALFAGQPPKVIQFDQWRKQPPMSLPAASPAPSRPAERRQAKKHAPGRSTVEQATLDFIPPPPSKTRKLKTDVEAQIFCDQPVATTTHRFVASAIDAAMILIGFGVVVVTVELMGATFGTGKQFWMLLGVTFALVALFYGLLWAITGRETAGMHFTDLRLITFDGFPVDARSRALRFASTWLSFCSAGLGLLWAVADEENLTWHDHISKTFPTIREVPRSFVKQR
ncbi:MAG TPA: RDD family protein [Bryobacteraceae bacterium]|nr:RDD family protein [Bryobacteraceae bacterium]